MENDPRSREGFAAAGGFHGIFPMRNVMLGFVAMSLIGCAGSRTSMRGTPTLAGPPPISRATVPIAQARRVQQQQDRERASEALTRIEGNVTR